MAALQILVLPVKVRILARQLSDERKTCYECNRFFYWWNLEGVLATLCVIASVAKQSNLTKI